MAETTSKATRKDSDESAKYFDFPKFIKEGSEFKVKKSAAYREIDSGIMYTDIKAGEGDGIKEKQKVSLHYNYYSLSDDPKESMNFKLKESMNFEGSLDELPNKFGPGLKEGIKDMKLHGKRRIIILPSKTDKPEEKAGPSSTDKPGDSQKGSKNTDRDAEKARESGLKSAHTPVEKGEVSKVELPGVFDVELLGIRRTWNPFG